ncbi:MAG: YgeY family selenium metabolism-linked hydrolase [Anaerolineae bacterium]|nr:YgeY family selenium metabolism-linked hydrolase [Anaerolineae bacterium]
MNNNIKSEIQNRVAARRDDIIQFMLDICAIPSMNSQIGPVGERIAQELKQLGFEGVRFDLMGNILGHIGSGPKTMVYDSHIDTVGIGDPASWEWDPFKGKIENGILFARGACDEKGSTPGMIYGLAIAKQLGLLEGWTCYYFGNMEEWCDGIAPNSFVEADPKIRPDFVVIGEPTRMQVYRGHKGRVELEITAKGRSAHAASNFLGDNAIYKLLPIIAGIRDLDATLPSDDFLGKAVVTVSDMKVSTVSLNAVPDQATIFIDRRVTFGETKESAIAAIDALIPDEQRDKIKLAELFYDEPSYTGFVFPVDKYYPAWALDESHLLVIAGQKTIESLWNETRPTGKWSFSTNGTYWAGKAGIPSIGFGPGDEIYAHSTLDQNKLDDVVAATEFYALLPKMINA